MVPSKGYGLKLLAMLLLAVLLPITITSIFSVMEMDRAVSDVQEKLATLNATSLNRSSLIYATSGNTDQEQLALAKAGQYEEFFLRIKTGNEVLAVYFSQPVQMENCTSKAGTWWSPAGRNATSSEQQSIIVRELCLPSLMLQRLVNLEGVVERGYVITADGLVVSWPPMSDILSSSSTHDPRNQPWYQEAQREGRTVWVPEGEVSGNDSLSITCATPVYRDIKLFGVVCLEVSLSAMYADLSLLRDRGYPFVIDSKGNIVMLPKVRRGDAPWDDLLIKGNLFRADSDSIRDLATSMTSGQAGSSVLSSDGRDWYIAYAPIPSTGWSLAIAFPAEDMLLPARYIESGVKDTARGATIWLEETSLRIRNLAIFTALFFALIFGALGIYMGKQFNATTSRMIQTAGRIGSGDVDFRVDTSGSDELADVEKALEDMRAKLKGRMGTSGTGIGQGRDRLENELAQELERDTKPAHIPLEEAFQIASQALSQRVSTFYDIFELEDGTIALTAGTVGGEGLSARVLAVVAKTLVRGLAPIYDPVEALSRANKILGEMARGMSVACFLGILDPEDGSLSYVNAGHATPFVVSAEGTVDTLSGGGISLGMLDTLNLEMDIQELGKGDLLVIYSDQMVDAKSGGLEKLISAVRASRDRNPEEIVDGLKKESGRITSAKKDALIIVIKYSPLRQRSDE